MADPLGCSLRLDLRGPHAALTSPAVTGQAAQDTGPCMKGGHGALRNERCERQGEAGDGRSGALDATERRGPGRGQQAAVVKKQKQHQQQHQQHQQQWPGGVDRGFGDDIAITADLLDCPRGGERPSVG
jgi:hypothetical protein